MDAFHGEGALRDLRQTVQRRLQRQAWAQRKPGEAQNVCAARQAHSHRHALHRAVRCACQVTAGERTAPQGRDVVPAVVSQTIEVRAGHERGRRRGGGNLGIERPGDRVALECAELDVVLLPRRRRQVRLQAHLFEKTLGVEPALDRDARQQQAARVAAPHPQAVAADGDCRAPVLARGEHRLWGVEQPHLEIEVAQLGGRHGWQAHVLGRRAARGATQRVRDARALTEDPAAATQPPASFQGDEGSHDRLRAGTAQSGIRELHGLPPDGGCHHGAGRAVNRTLLLHG